MYLSEKKCREFGVFLLAAGFHGPRKVTTLSLTNPFSRIRRIRIPEAEFRLDHPPVGLTMKPFALNYYPSETAKHPWLHEANISNLPVLGLGDAEDSGPVNEEQWAKRDTVWIPPDVGLFRLAELLLNAGCVGNPVREYQLEGDAGFRGVGQLSAELRIFLPGCHGWLFSGDDVPDSDQAEWYRDL